MFREGSFCVSRSSSDTLRNLRDLQKRLKMTVYELFGLGGGELTGPVSAPWLRLIVGVECLCLTSF